ncbi:hypothetical protein J4732_18330 [Serratia marcescens]|uniref:Glutamate--putrescine ligase n=1 Tax=Serratia marcescens TaxID=615 RepID=A0A939SNZ6_SERMA|nr:hypothetical protein [Serratia marcescens]
MQTNIVEVENFVQHSEERRSSAFQREVKNTERYPLTQHVDVLLTDLNGSFRGKRIPVGGLSKLEGLLLPASVFAMIFSATSSKRPGWGRSWASRITWCRCRGTLTPSADRQYIAQVLAMLDEDGTPFDVEPRNVLNRVWQRLRQRGLSPW